MDMELHKAAAAADEAFGVFDPLLLVCTRATTGCRTEKVIEMAVDKINHKGMS
jgi:hypothetical protein